MFEPFKFYLHTICRKWGGGAELGKYAHISTYLGLKRGGFLHISNETVEDTFLYIHKILGVVGQINLIFYTLHIIVA